MITSINGESFYHVGYVLQVIELYIFEKKGVRVKVTPGNTPKEIELFEKAANIALFWLENIRK
jgi:hypothetical protein